MMLLVTFGADDLAAQEKTPPRPLDSRAHATGTIVTVPSPFATPPIDLFRMQEQAVTLPTQTTKRPPALVPLYLSFSALQVLDIASTHHALDRGGREANPVVASVIDSTPATIAVKAGSTAAIIYLAERLRKRHPVAAVVLMVGLNAGYAGLVAHNYSRNHRRD
jgi:hypothetical protein